MGKGPFLNYLCVFALLLSSCQGSRAVFNLPLAGSATALAAKPTTNQPEPALRAQRLVLAELPNVATPRRVVKLRHAAHGHRLRRMTGPIVAVAKRQDRTVRVVKRARQRFSEDDGPLVSREIVVVSTVLGYLFGVALIISGFLGAGIAPILVGLLLLGIGVFGTMILADKI